MKRFTILLTFLVLGCTSCKKDPSLKDVVVKGKYMGIGCWPVVQIIEPSLSSIGLNREKATWPIRLASGNDTLYQNVVGAGPIPDTVMVGDVFYFKVSRIESGDDILTNANCLRTGYILTIKTTAFTKPGDNNTQ